MNIPRPSLAVYLMAGDETPDLAESAVRAGATVIELGIPYSDPLADGPTIQRASQRALDDGITPARALEILAEIDRRVDVPLVPMTYGAIVEGYGTEAFCRDAAAAGAEGLIVADIPPEESDDLRATAADAEIDLIHLVAPTSRPERLRDAAAASRGFVYLLANVGVTGAREHLDERVAEVVAQTRAAAGETPILGGFGVSRREHVENLMAAGADGAIVGSAAIDAIDAGGAAALGELVADLAAGLTSG